MQIARNVGTRRSLQAPSTLNHRISGSHPIFSTFEPRLLVAENILNFGAVGDGIAVNTSQMQKAIDHVAKNGGGVVEVPAGAFVTGSLLLRSHVTLHLSAGATILGSVNPADYRAEDSFLDTAKVMRGFALIAAVNARQVGIVGEGVIDGRGLELQKRGCWPNAKPFLVRWVRCNEVRVAGVTLQNASSRTVHAFQSKDVAYTDVEVRSYGLENNVGFDVDSCEQVRIHRCTIGSQDDAISIKTTSKRACRDVEVSHCTIRTQHDALKIGTASFGDIEDIRILNCNVLEAREGAVKVCSEDGANIRGVTVTDLQVQKADIPIYLRLGGRVRGPQEDGSSIGSISGVVFSNVSVADAARAGIFVSGIPGHRVEEVTLQGLSMKIRAGSAVDTWMEETSTTAYPDLWMPEAATSASGAVLRHVVCLKIVRFDLEVQPSDERPALTCDDMHHSSVEALRLTGGDGSKSVMTLRNSRNLKLTRIAVPASCDVLVRVQGAQCGQIRLAETDLPEAVEAFCFEEGASESMIVDSSRPRAEAQASLALPVGEL